VEKSFQVGTEVGEIKSVDICILGAMLQVFTQRSKCHIKK
jgi:hypothetical protein